MGKGVARNAATLLARWGFDVLHLARIDWAAVVGNDASRRVAEAVGFQYEGMRRSWLRRQYDDSRHDAWVMGLFATSSLLAEGGGRVHAPRR